MRDLFCQNYIILRMNADLLLELKLKQKVKEPSPVMHSEDNKTKKSEDEISTWKIIESIDQGNNNMILSSHGMRKSRKEVRDILTNVKQQTMKQSMHETNQFNQGPGICQLINMKQSCRQPTFKQEHQSNFQSQMAEMTRVSQKFHEILKSQQSILQIKQSQQIRLEAAIRLQRKFRFRKWKIWLQAELKKRKYRKNIINELITTEEIYVNDLNLVIRTIQQPSSKILSSKDFEIIFGHIEPIFKLNNSFLQDLKQLFRNYNFRVSTFGGLFTKYVPFFRLYSDYFSSYEKTKDVLNKLKSSNQSFCLLISKMSQSKEFKFLDLESFLIKPIQRLPKYPLLIKDLIKFTPTSHCDYEGLQKALQQFEKVNNQNDSKLNFQIISQKRLFELASIYTQCKIAEPNRNYIGEEFLTLILEEEKNTIIYQFNDLLLITEAGKLLYELFLDEQSSVIDTPNTSHYTNLFTLCGKNGSFTFSTDSKIEKMRFYQRLIDEIMQNKQTRQEAFQKNKQIALPLIKRNNPIHVVVLPFVLNSKETYYSVDISICNLSQKVYLTYNDCLYIQEEARKILQNFQINFLEVNKNHSESKQIQMQNFFLCLLTSIQVKQNPTKILELIGLPKNFYELPIKIDSYLQHEQQSRKESFRQGMNFDESILQEKIGRLDKEKHQHENKGNKQELKKVKIQTFLPSIETIEILITSQTKTINLYDIMQGKLGLSNIFDFKFVIFQDQYFSRPLEDDELILPFVSQSFWSSLFSESKPIYFRKYLFLDAMLEETLCKQDPIRLKLLQNQLVNDIFSGFFNLNFQEYCFFASLHFLLNTVTDCKKFPKALLEKIIPPQLLKATKQEIWEANIPKKLKSLCLSVTEQARECKKDIISIGQMIFVATLQKNKFYGVQLFLVKTGDLTKQTHPFLDQNPFVGISMMGVQVIDNKRKQIQLQFDYFELMPVKLFKNTVQFNTKNDFYQFEGPSVRNICELINEYEELQLIVDL